METRETSIFDNIIITLTIDSCNYLGALIDHVHRARYVKHAVYDTLAFKDAIGDVIELTKCLGIVKQAFCVFMTKTYAHVLTTPIMTVNYNTPSATQWRSRMLLETINMTLTLIETIYLIIPPGSRIEYAHEASLLKPALYDTLLIKDTIRVAVKITDQYGALIEVIYFIIS